MALKFDAMVPAQPLRQAADLGRRAAAAGLSGLVVTEAGRTAYLTCGALATAADIDILTGIAVAFPRSPMVTASTAWELAEASEGRFRLGLGAQVRAHIERRYGTVFDHPGPRLREYVLAVKAIFESFREGSPLAVEGEYYNLSLLPPMWAPGAIACDDPPVDVAAVNPWMLRMAGEVADGVHVHPLNTPTYLRETVLPNLEAGATGAGRRVEDLEVIVPAFLVVGDTEEERARWRELARVQVAFYGSTPNYAFIFDQLDREGTTDLIREQPAGGRHRRHGGGHRRRPAGELRHRGDLGRHRRHHRGQVRRRGDPGRQLLHRRRRGAPPRRLRAVGRAGPTGARPLLAVERGVLRSWWECSVPPLAAGHAGAAE